MFCASRRRSTPRTQSPINPPFPPPPTSQPPKPTSPPRHPQPCTLLQPWSAKRSRTKVLADKGWLRQQTTVMALKALTRCVYSCRGAASTSEKHSTQRPRARADPACERESLWEILRHLEVLRVVGRRSRLAGLLSLFPLQALPRPNTLHALPRRRLCRRLRRPCRLLGSRDSRRHGIASARTGRCGDGVGSGFGRVVPRSEEVGPGTALPPTAASKETVEECLHLCCKESRRGINWTVF
jgi:hypothetical protein